MTENEPIDIDAARPPEEIDDRIDYGSRERSGYSLPSESSLHNQYAPFAGTGLPVYIASDLTVQLQPIRRTNGKRVFLCSIPKAGSYLLSAVLEHLGLVPLGISISMNGFGDRRFLSKDQFIKADRTLKIDIPAQRAISFIGAGQFAHGQIDCNWAFDRYLHDLQVVFVYRNLRDVVVSHMRWVSRAHKGSHNTDSWRVLEDSPRKMALYMRDIGKEFLLSRCCPLLAWIERPGIARTSFEAICGDYGLTRQTADIVSIAEHCGVSISGEQAIECAAHVLKADTYTRSAARSRWQDVWDQEVENFFTSVGGPSLNRYLGYEE